MKLIFLDLDGVMLSTASTIRNGKDGSFGLTLHPEHVEALNYILKNTDARIVISSTYRFGYSVNETKQIFQDNGIDYKYVISHTPFILTPKIGKWVKRGDEIKQWLKRYPKIAKEKYGVEVNVDKYIIIDDDNDMLGYQQVNFIKTSKDYGLTHVEAQLAINKLNGIEVKKNPVIRRQYEHIKLLKGLK